MKIIFITMFVLALAVGTAYSQPQIWDPLPAAALPQPKFGRYFMRYLACADSMHCLVSLWDGDNHKRQAVIQTTDGGLTWHDVYSCSPYASPPKPITELNEVAYPSRDVAVVAGYNGDLMVSTDSCRTWTWKTIVRRTNNTFPVAGRVRMSDATHGAFIPMQISDVMAFTWDTWKTWDTVSLLSIPICDSSSVPLATSGPACVGDSTVLAPVYEARRFFVIRSGDRGKTWGSVGITVPVDSVVSVFDSRFSFVDNLHGWFMFTTGNSTTHINTSTVYLTDDAGKTWRQVFYSTTIGGVSDIMNCIAAHDTNSAVIGGNKKIYRTTNGGATWVAEIATGAANGEVAITSVSYPSGTRTGLAIAFPYTIYRNSGQRLGVWESRQGKPDGLKAVLNPASDVLTVFTSSGQKIARAVLYDPLGRHVLRAGDQGGNEPTFNVTGLPSGAYRVVIRFRDGTLQSLPVIIQK